MTDHPGHLDLDALADVLAGVSDDTHLHTCRPCTDRLAELAAADAATRAALAALPPLPLPDGLSARLQEAFEQEALQQQVFQQEGPPQVATVRPLRRRTAGWLPSVAASVALVTAGALGWSLLGSAGPQSADTAGGGGQESAVAPDDAAGGDAAGGDAAGGDAAGGDAAGGDAAGGDAAGGDAAGGDAGGGDAGETAPEAAPEAAAGLTVPRAGTATDWADAAARPAAVVRLLNARADSSEPAGATPTDDGLDRLRDPAALAACLSALPRGSGGVLAVDYAQYARVPAVAVVQPAQPGAVAVTVVGSSCSAADPALLDEVVLPRR